MKQSNSPGTPLVLAICLACSINLAGCRENGNSASQISPATSAAAAPISNPGQSQAVLVGATSNGSDPVDPNAASDGSGVGDEEPARTPVSVFLKNGRATNSTPRVFHVPPGIDILLDISTLDENSDKATVEKPSGVPVSVIKLTGIRETDRVIAALAAGESYTVRLEPGGTTIRIAADAEPGP